MRVWGSVRPSDAKSGGLLARFVAPAHMHDAGLVNGEARASQREEVEVGIKNRGMWLAPTESRVFWASFLLDFPGFLQLSQQATGHGTGSGEVPSTVTPRSHA